MTMTNVAVAPASADIPPRSATLPTLQVTVAVGTPPGVTSALADREQRATWAPGEGRVEMFAYRDLVIRLARGAGIRDDRADDLLAARYAIELHRPDPFYDWTAPTVSTAAEAFSAIVVNRMDPEHSGRVAALFGDLDASDFPSRMGTRSRQVYSFAPDRYLHVQDLGEADGLDVIDGAWRDADPRFVRICEDLTPLVPAYDDTCVSHEDHLAERVFLRTQS
nr:TcmI family type II polyketide cyclase [Rhodococcus sp. (in: high G+C Gram-positive bacteria)]